MMGKSVTHLNESCHTCKSYCTYTYQAFFSIVAHMNESCRSYKYVKFHTAHKASGIRRVSNPSTSIDPGSLQIDFLKLIQNAGFVRDNGTNYTKEGHRGRKPVSEKLLGRSICAILWCHTMGGLRSVGSIKS